MVFNEQILRETLAERLDPVTAPPAMWDSIRSTIVAKQTRPKPTFRLPRRAWVLAPVAVALVALVVTMLQVLQDDVGLPDSPFLAVAEAYTGLLALETVEYTLETVNSDGERRYEARQVDLVNRVEYTQVWEDVATVESGPPDIERVTSGEQQWVRLGTSAPWRQVRNTVWQPFRRLGELPWGGENAVSGEFDSIERLEEVELDGILATHYLAKITLRDPLGEHVGTVDIWVGMEDALFHKIDWRLESTLSPQSIAEEDLNRNFCEGLGNDFQEVRLYANPQGDGYVDAPPSPSIQPARILCENRTTGSSETVWTAPVTETEVQTVRWTYAFSGFNTELRLPELP